MTRLVVLDTGVLGLVTHPRGSAASTDCTAKLLELLESGERVCIAEICDYELRREYLRRDAKRALKKLDELQASLEYVALDSGTMREAAALWAQSRRVGHPTADPKELDGDVILAAQAKRAATREHEVIVATDNVGHLDQFVAAATWESL